MRSTDQHLFSTDSPVSVMFDASTATSAGHPALLARLAVEDPEPCERAANATQRTSGMHRILSVPLIYDMFQSLLGASRARRRLVRDVIRPAPGQRILDVGCGTAAILKFLPDVEYSGIDLSPEYIAKCRQRFPDRVFLVGRADELPCEWEGSVDRLLALGVLHHLNEAQVSVLLASALRLLAPAGRFIAVDPTFVARQHPVARFLVRSDRGLNVRAPHELLALARRHFPDASVMVRTDLLRVPYTHVVLECPASN
jgi:SAM-dependent methyltransferase